MKENKLMKNIAWGISAFIGFVVAERLYETTINKLEQEKEEIEEEA